MVDSWVNGPRYYLQYGAMPCQVIQSVEGRLLPQAGGHRVLEAAKRSVQRHEGGIGDKLRQGGSPVKRLKTLTLIASSLQVELSAAERKVAAADIKVAAIQQEKLQLLKQQSTPTPESPLKSESCLIKFH